MSRGKVAGAYLRQLCIGAGPQRSREAAEDSGACRVTISYEQDGVPRVRIKEPEIAPAPNHSNVWGRHPLCLYKPTDDPWKSSDNIHEKIILWTAEWLLFYELYLMCGRWLGPEAEHGTAEKDCSGIGRWTQCAASLRLHDPFDAGQRARL